MNDSRAKIALINLWNCTYNYKADGNWLFSIFQADYFNSYSRDAGYTVKRNLDQKGSQMGQIYISQRLARSSGSGGLLLSNTNFWGSKQQIQKSEINTYPKKLIVAIIRNYFLALNVIRTLMKKLAFIIYCDKIQSLKIILTETTRFYHQGISLLTISKVFLIR